MGVQDRRPIKTRSAAWAQALARQLARWGLTPNQISMLSIGFALPGAWWLGHPASAWSLIGAAACVQLRLVANLLDGMVAIEEGRQTPLGPLYNEVPDRVTDTLFLMALGQAVQRLDLGVLAALAAMMTAYVRVLGATLGQSQDFRGPMAKSHRMAVLTATCLLAAATLAQGYAERILMAGLLIILSGSLGTVLNRLWAIATRAQGRP